MTPIASKRHYPELFQRHEGNPILTANDWPYPAHTVFNAAACQVGDTTLLLCAWPGVPTGFPTGGSIPSRRSRLTR